MPWARIPPDRLIFLPMFGINVIKDDGEFVWYGNADGRRMRVQKRNPRIWFDDVGDAHQAGATAILQSSDVSSIADVQPDDDKD